MAGITSGTDIRRVVLRHTDSSLVYRLTNESSKDAYYGFETTLPTEYTNDVPYPPTQRQMAISEAVDMKFTGTRVWALGSYGYTVKAIDPSVKPYWSCSVDSKAIESFVSFSDADNTWVLCDSGSIEDAEHTITMIADGDRRFLFDQFQYLPSQRSVPSFQPTVVIDKTDPAVTYKSGTWNTTVGGIKSSVDVNATISVEFTGAKATWYGSLPPASDGVYLKPPQNGTALVYLDNDNPRRIVIPWSPRATPKYNKGFFTAESLTRGTHTIKVVLEDPQFPLTLDYLTVENGEISTSAPTQQTPVATTASNGHSTRNKAAIAGITVGVALFLVLVGVGVGFYLRRRRRSVPKIRLADPDSLARPELEPYYHVEPFEFSGVIDISASPLPHRPHPFAEKSRRPGTPTTEGTTTPTTQTPLQEQLALPPPLGDPTSPEGKPKKRKKGKTASESLAVRLPMAYSTRDPIVSRAAGNSSQSLQGLHSSRGSSAAEDVGAHDGERIVMVNRHQDSGVRIPGVEVVDLPPLYSER